MPLLPLAFPPPLLLLWSLLPWALWLLPLLSWVPLSLLPGALLLLVPRRLPPRWPPWPPPTAPW